MGRNQFDIRSDERHPLWAVTLYVQVKLYIPVLFINEKNEAAIYRQWFVI
jgi:hypothetical protein